MRHGRTDYSARYLVNGDTRQLVDLDGEGVRATCAARGRIPVASIRTVVTSAFLRAQQTAHLLVDHSDMVVECDLNELDYGMYEGCPFLEYAAWLQLNGPWVRPPQAVESQREAQRRILGGLKALLNTPGPRFVVGHGLMMSMLLWQQERPTEPDLPLFYPEAPYLEPLALDDKVLAEMIHLLEPRLHEAVLSQSGIRAPRISSDGESTVLGPSGVVSIPLEGNTDA